MCVIFLQRPYFFGHIYLSRLISLRCGYTYLIINIFETKIKMFLWAVLFNGSNVLSLRDWLLKILWKALFKLLKILAFGIFNVKSWEHMVQKVESWKSWISNYKCDLILVSVPKNEYLSDTTIDCCCKKAFRSLVRSFFGPLINYMNKAYYLYYCKIKKCYIDFWDTTSLSTLFDTHKSFLNMIIVPWNVSLNKEKHTNESLPTELTGYPMFSSSYSASSLGNGRLPMGNCPTPTASHTPDSFHRDGWRTHSTGFPVTYAVGSVRNPGNEKKEHC